MIWEETEQQNVWGVWSQFGISLRAGGMGSDLTGTGLVWFSFVYLVWLAFDRLRAHSAKKKKSRL